MFSEKAIYKAHYIHLDGIKVKDKSQILILMKRKFWQFYSLAAEKEQKQKRKRRKKEKKNKQK